MANTIRCPRCGSTNVECVEKPRHDHICHDCGHTLLPRPGRFCITDALNAGVALRQCGGATDESTEDIDLPTPAMRRMDLRVIGLKADNIRLRDELNDLIERATSTADFLDSYTDESELAKWSPVLVEIMRRYAVVLREGYAMLDGTTKEQP